MSCELRETSCCEIEEEVRMITKNERIFVLDQAAEARNRGMVLVLVLGNDQSEKGEALRKARRLPSTWCEAIR